MRVACLLVQLGTAMLFFPFSLYSTFSQMSLASFGTVFTAAAAASNRQLGSCVPFTTTLIITLMSVLQLASAANSAPLKDNANE